MNARELLKHLMDQAGDNSNSLARKTKVPQPTLYRFLSGTATEPRVSTFEPIAKHYGVPVEIFLSDKARAEFLLGQRPAAQSPDGLQAVAGSAVEPHEWPFSAPFEQYEALDAEKKQRLDERVSDFLAGAAPAKGVGGKRAA